MQDFVLSIYKEHFFDLEIIFRLLLALLLGGIIGYERENLHRPAGLRTHILVCVGAALVMITSEFLFDRYDGLTNADPARLGAQVISGIGFLGAGTIIREGVSVKGLTTAASLWAVSCVGLAAGIGFYKGAVSATLLIYFTLMAMKRMQGSLMGKRANKFFYVHADYLPERIKTIKAFFDSHDVLIKNIEFIDEGDKNAVVKFLVRTPRGLKKEVFVDEALNVGCINKIYEY